MLEDEAKVGLHAAMTPVWNEAARLADCFLPMGVGAERHDTHSYETRPGMPVAPAAPPLEVAAARAAVYRLLGRLHLIEVDGPVLEALRAWRAFAPSLTAGDDADLRARLRAEYARRFLLNAHPYESVYADSSAMPGGEASVAEESAYAEAGFEVGGVPRPAAPDHAGAEMLFVSALVEAPIAVRRAAAGAA